MRALLAASLILVASCASQPAPQFVNTPDGRLLVDAGGKENALPVLLVHGNGANSTQWYAQLQHLRMTRPAVAFDLRGMGRSDVPASGDYSVQAMVSDIHTVANTLGLNRFVIVGHSYGGAVVAAYAAAHPERVAGVVFADAAGGVRMNDAQMERLLNALRADKPAVIRQWFEPILENASPEVKAAVLESVDRTSVEAFAAAFGSLRQIDMRALVDAYPGPKLAIVAAGNDNPAALHVQFPEIPRRDIAGVSHWLMMDKPEEFNRVLDEFLARLK